MEKKKRRKYYKEDKEPSVYELHLQSNERFYKGHFDNIEHVKYCIAEAQKALKSDDDPRNKELSLKLINLTQKRLAKLESRTPEVTEYYERTKKYLESLR